jgi:hypothetical protein
MAINGLVQQTIDAHGGLDRWQQFEYVSARLRVGGVLWALKHQQGLIDDVRVRVALRREWASHSPFGGSHLRTSFEPHRVAIEATDGTVVDERLDPRSSFAGHALDTPWDRLQLAYFAGYAMWTYLTTPFLFVLDGVSTEELPPSNEGGETFRRLKVTFPSEIATHGSVQVFHIGANGLVHRHDYDVDVLACSPAAHYVHDYQDASGILVPTSRRVLPRLPDGSALPGPLLVTIDLSDVEFT